MSKINLPLTAITTILLFFVQPRDGVCDEPYRNPYSKIDYALTVEDAQSVIIPHGSTLARDALRRVCNELHVSVIVASDRKLFTNIPAGTYSLRKAMQTIFPDCQALYYENVVVVLDPVFAKANPILLTPLKLHPGEASDILLNFNKYFKDTSCSIDASPLWQTPRTLEATWDELKSNARSPIDILRIIASRQPVTHILTLREIHSSQLKNLNENCGSTHARAYSVNCTPGICFELPEVSWSRLVCVLDQGIKVSCSRKDGKHIEWVIKNGADKQRILFPNAERFAALFADPNLKSPERVDLLVYQSTADVIPDKIILQPGETLVVSFDLQQARVRKLRTAVSDETLNTQTEATCMLKEEDFVSDYEQMAVGWDNTFYPSVEYHDAAGNIYRAVGKGMHANGVEWDTKPETVPNKDLK